MSLCGHSIQYCLICPGLDADGCSLKSQGCYRCTRALWRYGTDQNDKRVIICSACYERQATATLKAERLALDEEMEKNVSFWDTPPSGKDASSARAVAAPLFVTPPRRKLETTSLKELKTRSSTSSSSSSASTASSSSSSSSAIKPKSSATPTSSTKIRSCACCGGAAGDSWERNYCTHTSPVCYKVICKPCYAKVQLCPEHFSADASAAASPVTDEIEQSQDPNAALYDLDEPTASQAAAYVTPEKQTKERGAFQSPPALSRKRRRSLSISHPQGGPGWKNALELDI